MNYCVRHIFITLAISCFFLGSTPVLAKKVGGVTLPDSLEVAGQSLVLNGAGRRTKTILKLYVGALYLPAESNDANAIIQADEPMAIQLNILSGLLSKKKMKAALIDGFNKSTGGNTAPIQVGIDKLLALMDDTISKRDVYVLAYDPANGTQVTKNGELVGAVEGLALKQALFGIWLSDNPVQGKLKKAMLGG